MEAQPNDSQHIVTRAYLDRFIDPQKVAENDRVLFPYAKGGFPCRPRGTKRIGCAQHFYSYRRDDGSYDNSVDKGLQEFERLVFSPPESKEGAFARCLRDDDTPKSLDDRVVLAAVAAVMRCRSPVQMHNFAAYGDMCNQIWAFNMLKAPHVLAAYMEGGMSKEDAEAAIDADREELLKGELRVEVSDERRFGLESLKHVQPVIETLMQLRMRLIRAYRTDVFVTSDNPVVVHVPDDPRGEGLTQTPQTEIWFPISHNRGLLFDQRPGRDGVEQAGHSQTIVLNRRIVKWSYRFVYSPQKIDWLASAVTNEQFNPLMRRMKSVQDIVDFSSADVVNLVDYMKQPSSFDLFAGVPTR